MNWFRKFAPARNHRVEKKRRRMDKKCSESIQQNTENTHENDGHKQRRKMESSFKWVILSRTIYWLAGISRHFVPAKGNSLYPAKGNSLATNKMHAKCQICSLTNRLGLWQLLFYKLNAFLNCIDSSNCLICTEVPQHMLLAWRLVSIFPQLDLFARLIGLPASHHRYHIIWIKAMDFHIIPLK